MEVTGLTAAPQNWKDGQRERTTAYQKPGEQEPAAGAKTRVEKQTQADEWLEAQCRQARGVSLPEVGGRPPERGLPNIVSFISAGEGK